MISGANIELYVQLLSEYTSCPVHPTQLKPLEARPGDNEPQLQNPPEIISPNELPEVPPEPEGLPPISPNPDGIEIIPTDDEDNEGDEDGEDDE